MTAERKESCPLCGNNEYHRFKHKLWICMNCGLIVDEKIWEKSANVKQEEEWFESERPQESFWVRAFESLNNKRTWRRLRRHIPLAGMVLEIGVGSGALLGYMKNKGVNVEGCDLSKTICKRAQKIWGVTMYNCFLADLPRETQYDAVVVNHVLEHVDGPIQFLKDVRNRLKNEGVVHIGVPNVSCWQALLPGWNSYEPYHLVYFSPATLQQAVKQAGFKVLRIRTHDSFSGWFLALLRTLLRTNKKSAGERLTEREAAHLSWMGHAYRLAMVLSGIITLPLRLLQQAIGRGDEVVLIARKADEKAT